MGAALILGVACVLGGCVKLFECLGIYMYKLFVVAIIGCLIAGPLAILFGKSIGGLLGNLLGPQPDTSPLAGGIKGLAVAAGAALWTPCVLVTQCVLLAMDLFLAVRGAARCMYEETDGFLDGHKSMIEWLGW